MTSFIPALSLIVLVLANGYLTIPVPGGDQSSSTYYPSVGLSGDETTAQTKSLRYMHENDTTAYPTHNVRSLFQHMGDELSSTPESLPENASREPRTFDDDNDKSSTSATAEPEEDKRSEDNYTSTTIETKPEKNNFPKRDEIEGGAYQSILTTPPEQDEDKRSEDEERKREAELDERDMPIESATSASLLFSSTSSAAAPTLYSPSSSPKNYPGSLRDDPPTDVDQSDKSTPKSSLTTTANFPNLYLDKNIFNVNGAPNDAMNLDDDNNLVVTDFPATTTGNPKEVKSTTISLNQGSTLLLFLLAALLFCACVMASTLAFVDNRHNLKRKSRINEMEAYLDEQYPHPLIFQQHYGK